VVEDEITEPTAVDAASAGAAGVSPRAVVAGGGQVDLTTHADLGIAYKEMGLFDAAIKEFLILAQDSTREVFALTMIGECHEAKGAPPEAVVHYKKALNRPQIGDAEATQLYYQLGTVFQTLGDKREALYFFEKVAKRDPQFRDVARRVTALRSLVTGVAS
jgi:tetratricopeptide (TPR) repeat protein